MTAPRAAAPNADDWSLTGTKPYQYGPYSSLMTRHSPAASANPSSGYSTRTAGSRAVRYPAVMSTSSHRRSRQVAGSLSIPKVRAQGLASLGIGRYADGIFTPPHCAASTRRQSANIRTRSSIQGVVMSPMPIGISEMDTSASV